MSPDTYCSTIRKFPGPLGHPLIVWPGFFYIYIAALSPATSKTREVYFSFRPITLQSDAVISSACRFPSSVAADRSFNHCQAVRRTYNPACRFEVIRQKHVGIQSSI